jgi:chemotaxis protein MotB
MSEGGHELIIVRRHEEEEHEHHSSAWKVAHADFMTAMMAFFLIMWLISVTDDEMRKGIAQFFNPIHMSAGSTDLKGLNRSDEKADKESRGKGKSELPMPGAALNALQLSAGSQSSKSLSPEQAAEATAKAAEALAKATAAAKKVVAEAGKGEGAKEAAGTSGADGAAALAAVLARGKGASAGEGDRAAFQDPYAVLAKLAEEYSASHAMSADVVDGDDRAIGVAGGDVDRDPFDPAYWQFAPLPPARADRPGKPGSLEKLPAGVQPDAAAPAGARDVASNPSTAEPPPPGAAKAEARPLPPPAPKVEVVPTKVAAEANAIESEIAKSVSDTIAGRTSPEISVKATSEGALINLTDDDAFSMFKVGSAIPDPKVVVLMEKIGKVLAGRPGKVVIRGYTDARPFRSADYDNWRLSAARAHMAHYMLTRGGVDEARIVAIEGRADRDLKNPRDPLAAENRRIEILLKAGN